ncbi:hypothetical protein Bca4012_009568 [Brassica carinata]
MANSYTLLADLRAERCSNTAEVRLLRLWEARNINRGGELMSLEMLLIDESDTLVQGCVPAVLQRILRERLTEGSVYTLSGFDVTRSNPKFRLTDGPVSIRFNEGTAVEKLATTARTIPTEHFRFRTHQQILELAKSGRQLPDVIGELRAIRSTITDMIPGAQRVMLTLRVDRLPGGGRDEAGSSSKVVHAQKIESLTIDELNQFVISAEPQIIEFLCTARVTEIQLGDVWSYIGCSLCSKKLIREETSFTCPSCNETQCSGRTQVSVVAKLTQVIASEAAQIVGIGVNAQVDTALPRSLADIVGNSYTFQLKLTDFNFTANHQTFTISRIFTAPQMAPNPNFDADVHVPIPPVPRNVTPGSEATGSIGNNVAGEASASDGPPARRAAVEEHQNAPDESAPKKARVE